MIADGDLNAYPVFHDSIPETCLIFVDTVIYQ